MPNKSSASPALPSLPRPRPLKARPTVRDLIDPRLLIFLDLSTRDPEHFAALRVLAEARIAQLDMRRRRRLGNE